MSAAQPPQHVNTDSIEPAEPPSRLPLLGSLAVGLICALVINYALPGMFRLSSLAFLMFYLGLFFFMLYGLLIGAFMFRAGRSAQPAPKSLLMLIGITVAVALWGGGLYQEYRVLPGLVAESIRGNIDARLTPQQETELREGIGEHLMNHFAEHHPPGGFAGYLQWMAGGEPITCPFILTKEEHLVRLPQQGAGFLFRSIVSLGLIVFGILSQFLGLATDPRAAPVTTAEPPPEAELPSETSGDASEPD